MSVTVINIYINSVVPFLKHKTNTSIIKKGEGH